MPYKHIADLSWIYVKDAIGGLGGFAGLAKIYDWLTRGAKITGSLENRVSAEKVLEKDRSLLGSIILVQIYLVNKRISPVTIKIVKLKIKIDGTWVYGQNSTIPEGFSLPNTNVNFSASRLYDKVGMEALEYGKGVRGWMFFFFPSIKKVDLLSCMEKDCKVEVIDAFDKKHTIDGRYDQSIATPGLQYFPGSGVSQG